MSSQQSTTEVFRRSAEFLQEGAIDAWLALFADDAVLEFPFAPPGAPSRVEGRTSLSDHVKARASRMDSPRIERLKVHVTEDATTIVAEMSLIGGQGQTRPAIAVVTVRDGLITLYRDYWNPLDIGVNTGVAATKA